MVGRRYLSKGLTIVISVGVYYIWTIILEQNNTTGIVLGTITAILTVGVFNKFKK
ncbi:MAG: hypothetical protein HGA27_02205 [Peptococcaceae bacterium]|nr:hypothetical protein [Peptococcaceae bacterium]